MNNFVIIITAPVENSYSGCEFSRSLLASGKSIEAIFFYQQGVNCANALIDLPGDEPNIQRKWSELAKQSKVPLLVCSASALRRGVSPKHLAAGFQFASIGQLVLACDKADKVVQL